MTLHIVHTEPGTGPEEGITYSLFLHPEDVPVRGNAMASGDDEKDREAEDEILSRVNADDGWAWCCVEVRASFGPWEGSDFLGCCSYRDAADFMQEGGYYDDMKKEALEDLRGSVERTAELLGALPPALLPEK